MLQRPHWQRTHGGDRSGREGKRADRGHISAMLLSAFGVAASAVIGGLLVSTPEQPTITAEQRVESEPLQPQQKLTPLDVQLRDVPRLQAMFTPVDIPGGEGGIAGAGGGCQTVLTHSGANFEGGSFVVQAGFAENEVAAAQFTIPANHFPIILDLAEMIFAQQNATVTTTTEWSLLVWEGNPQTGTLIETFSSDGVILPHIVMPPGTQGVNVQVSVDPGDPEQIVIQNNGSNSFTIGYRIDKHNNQTSNPCFIAPPSNSNAFPTTDPTGMTSITQNWLGAVDCGPFGCPQGYSTFQQLPGSPGSLCTPSGDWNIRATYTPANLQTFNGACCLPGPLGGCQFTTNCHCDSIGGTFAGPSTQCGSAGCPTAGACCDLDLGTCTNALLPDDCAAIGGTYAGANTSCGAGACALLTGACCVPATGACVNGQSPGNCDLGGGIWQGQGTSCASTVCFPEGACCMPDGSCAGPLSPEDCDLAGGMFQGDGIDCGSANCPQPVGACCLSNGNCLTQNEANCAGFGGQWQGMGTSCPNDCEDPKPECPGDLDGNNTVNVFDLLELLGSWGPCQGCAADLDGNDVVNVFDLLQLLGAWGSCET